MPAEGASGKEPGRQARTKLRRGIAHNIDSMRNQTVGHAEFVETAMHAVGATSFAFSEINGNVP
jgi:hypothetical protein